MHKLLLAACCLLSLTACSTEYIIMTTDDQLITTGDKPKLDEKTGMYHFEDTEGREQQLDKSMIKQMFER